ncbi:MAG: hypothetical protein KIH10_00955 [Candidatus Freyarchaeota archaeon]|nr:hypothetical protein [Candidatus Jordarchaeia archaeon]MBS7278694.1 hypothetical protein [Candidatus Jordarchaeia archaeon]
MSMKSPTADDVFKKWLERTDLGKLEKAFSVKHVKFERSNVSASESVKNVEKHAVFFFHSKIEPSISKEAEKKLVDIDELRKVTFYDFGNKQVDLTEWKDKNLVPLYSSIREVSCSECNGKGFIACDKCKGSGTLECKKCKGTGSLTCDACKGEKKLHLKLKVITAEGKKTDIEMPYNCDLCGGVGTIYCDNCAGTGKIDCDKCHGGTKTPCKKCKATGTLFEYTIGPVPFKPAVIPKLFFRPEFEKYLGKVIDKEFANIEGIVIRDYENLTEKELTPQLGFFNKEVNDKMKKAKDTFKELEKKAAKGGEKPEYPIYVYPLLKLDVESPRGKKFTIFSIGTERGYIVTDYGF